MSEKSLTKITPKYHCMVSGEKRMAPCSGCTNPTGCVSSAMQYKENDQMEEKAIVKIDADGAVKACAKGLGLSECGYKAGAKVCGKCGAMAVSVKEDGEEPDLFDDDFFGEETEEKMYGAKRPKGKRGMMDQMVADSMESEMEDEEEMDDEEDMGARRKMAKKRRLESMGMKSDEVDDNAFMCAFERKVYAGNSGACENCPGGCASENDMPGLLEIEGIAMDMFSGKVLDSGYSDEADMYVLDVERKDGKTIEAFFDGSSGECMGWHMLPEDEISEKSAIADMQVIDFNKAAEIAVKSVEGEVLSVDPDVFEGYDSYAVEIMGLDGKSYDVYVSLDGEVLGYDEYTAEEAEEIEAEAAEIALKRAYSEESRMDLAKRGFALPDGSYPIKDRADLENAIRAYGRAKDKAATKAHIMKRAMDLGLEELIPTNWVPKKVQEEYADGKKDASDEFLASLMEFEILTAEEDSRDILGDTL